MKCPNCHRDIPNGSNFCPYCRADLAMYNPNNQQPVYPTPNQVRNRPSSKNAKLIILIVSIVLLAVAVIAGGIILLLHNSSNDQTAVPTVSVEDAITREEWIAMLADKEGYTECKSDKSYFDDIDKSNDNYKKIQSCAEWGIIDKGGNFLPNDKATIDFAVTTAIKSIGINYISNNDKKISTDDEIIDYYKEKTGDYFSDKSYVDSNYANQILDNAKQIKDGITLKNSGSVSYKKGVKKAQPNEVKIKGKKATVSQKLKKGDILVIEPCDKYPSGKAMKVKKVKGKKIEYTTPGLDEFLGEYSFTGEAAPTVTAVSSSDKDTTVKIKTTDAGNISAVSPAAVSPLALAGSESTTNTSGTNLFDYEIELSKEIGKTKISGIISLKNLVMRVDDFNAVGITVKNCNASLSYDIATKIKVSGKAEAKIPVRVDAKLFGVLGAAIKITVKVGLDGSVTVSSATTITETMKYKTGAIPIFKQNVEKPNVDLQLKIKGYVNPEICIAGEVFNVDLFDFGGTVGLFNAEAAKNKYGCLDIKAYVPLELFINSEESALGKLKLKAKWIIWDSKSSKIQKSWHIESGKIVDKCTTPKPTTKPKESKIEKQPTVGNWRKAYTDFLKEYMNEAENPDDCGFSLVYIDNDDAPELVVRDGSSHYSAAYVYTCRNSKIVKLVGNLGGTYGMIQYIEKKGLIYSLVEYQGHGRATIYSVNSDTCKQIISFYSDEDATDEGMDSTYKINDKVTTKEKYYNAWKKYEDKKLLSSGSSDMALTSENIESIAN